MILYSKSYGQGFPLIILHGIFGSSGNWATVSKKLGDRYKVFAVDLRNHGRSPHNHSHSLQDMARDLELWMREKKIERAHIIGHSMGGKTAMKFAIEFPEKVEKLIVVDIAVKEYKVQHDELISILLNLKLQNFKSRSEIENEARSKIKDEETLQLLLKNLQRKKDQYVWKINLPVLKKDLQKIGEKITGIFEKESLFIRGENSNYITDSDRDMIKSVFPKSSVITIKDAGHWVHAEQPEVFCDVVKGFLK